MKKKVTDFAANLILIISNSSEVYSQCSPHLLRTQRQWLQTEQSKNVVSGFLPGSC